MSAVPWVTPTLVKLNSLPADVVEALAEVQHAPPAYRVLFAAVVKAVR